MNPDKAEQLARRLMDDNDLAHWQFKFDDAKVRFGQCDCTKKVISLSFYLTVLNEEADVADVIKHEIAHAVDDCRNGHNDVWKATARRLGASANRTYDGNSIKAPTGKWIGTCSSQCGFKTKPRHRRDKGRCPRCFSPIDWNERNAQHN